MVAGAMHFPPCAGREGGVVFEAVVGLESEQAELERQLADPATHADQALSKRLKQRYAEVTSIVRTWTEWRRLGDDGEAARELAGEDPAFAGEAERLERERSAAEGHLRH